jgi:hypothetical protein
MQNQQRANKVGAYSNKESAKDSERQEEKPECRLSTLSSDLGD